MPTMSERRKQKLARGHVVMHGERPNERRLPRYWADYEAKVVLVVPGSLGKKEVIETWELLNLGARGAMVFLKPDEKTMIQDGQVVCLTKGIKNLPVVEARVVSRRLLDWRGRPLGLNLKFVCQLNLAEGTRAAFFAWTKGKVQVGMREKRMT